MQEKLDERIAFLQALYQGAPEGSLILDENGLIIWINKTVNDASKKRSSALMVRNYYVRIMMWK